MDSSRRKLVEELFDAVVDLDPDARSAYLDEHCTDPTLREDVGALLRAHDRAEGVLEGSLARAAAAAVLDAPGPAGAESASERRIGPYVIRDELGRGGMGVVYLAERSDGQFRRRVALKVIRADHDADLRARVVAERQILASLDHPNIVKLLDAGTTRDGRTYLVMEHVSGLPLDVYCDRMRLSIRERVRLFVSVARGVEHAHHNLVVHRDLKPSNILVTAEGRVKILDFGIAKLLNPALAGVDAPVTRQESRVLTPEYASPEQLRGEALTTASDVYSLGVLLYRLLTGHPPHDPADGTVSAVLSAMLERDPERPSVKATRPRTETLPDGSKVTRSPLDLASDRRSTSHRLPRTLAGDLDAIVMKALRKEPTRRYGSAESLAQDLESYLRGEPVAAHKDTRGYRLAKMVRRHKVEALAAAAAALALMAGAATTAWQARVARRERDRAAEALRQSEVALGQSEAVTDFLMELFQAGDPMVEGDLTASDLVRRGVGRVEELGEQPLVQARMLEVLGQLQRHMGLDREARPLLERAVGIRRAALGSDHPDVASALIELARVERNLGSIDEARDHVGRALEIRRKVHPGGHPDVAEAVFELGWIEKGEDQEALYREALSIHRGSGGDPRTTGAMLTALATNIRRQGRLEEAVVTAQEATDVLEGAVGPNAPETGVSYFHLGDHLRDVRKDYDRAEQLYRRGLGILESEFGEHSLRLIHGIHSLAIVHSRRGEHAEAEALFRRAVELRRTAAGRDSPMVIGSLEPLAMEIARQGRFDEAEGVAREALDLRERTYGVDHPSRYTSLMVLGEISAMRGRLDDARRYMREVFALRERSDGPDDIVLAEFRRRWGRILVEAGRFDEAEPVLLQALRGLESAYPEGHPNRVDARRAVHELYAAWDRPELAARYEVPPGEFFAY